jgi:phosphohistidine swiveling domain-containing protein
MVSSTENKVYLLPSQPSTTLSGFDPTTGEFNSSLTGDYTWSCVNVGEAVSVVMTPLTWSLLREAFSQLDIVPGHPSLGNIGGRPYQNVTVMASTFRALGRNWANLSTELGGVRPEYLETMGQYLSPLPGVTLFSVLPGAIRMIMKQRRGLKDLEGFLLRNRHWCETICQRIRSAETGAQLATLMDEELMPIALESFWRVIATTLRHSELVAKVRRQLVKAVSADDADILLSNTSNQDQLLASMGPLIGLAKVARGEMTKGAYLEQWGHRGPEETEAYIPRPFENPEWFDRQLEAFAESPVDVEGLLAVQRAKLEAAWQRLQDQFPRKAGPMRRRLARAAAAARTREATRSEVTRQMWVLRVWGLQVGALTGLDDGAFFLTIDELQDLLVGKGAPTATIPERRQTYERYKALPPYPLLIRGRFDPFQWAADPERRSDVYDSHGLLTTLKLEAPEQNVILGMPGSAGQVTGTVRRLDRAEDGDQLKIGEILVTKQTNIGWTLFFARAGAIITEVGAPLSHAAMVARELGIPAVVNCGDATTRLKTGDRVRVDGTCGRVEILTG